MEKLSECRALVQKKRMSGGACSICYRNQWEISVLAFPDENKKICEFAKWTCKQCGYTMFFDLDK